MISNELMFAVKPMASDRSTNDSMKKLQYLKYNKRPILKVILIHKKINFFFFSSCLAIKPPMK